MHSGNQFFLKRICSRTRNKFQNFRFFFIAVYENMNMVALFERTEFTKAKHNGVTTKRDNIRSAFIESISRNRERLQNRNDAGIESAKPCNIFMLPGFHFIYDLLCAI